MPGSPPKHIAILAAVSFVLIASLLVFNASDYDGEGSDDTTNKWSEANAIIFFNNQSETYYKTIQGAVDAAEAAAKESGLNSVTIYVKGQTVTESISVDYVKAASGNGFLEITIRGIGPSEPTGDPGNSSPVTIKKDDQLKGPVFHVEGRLILDGITIVDDIVDEQETPSNGDESQSAPAI